MPELPQHACGALRIFDHATAVTYRELWGGRVMTAIPMRVITDSDQQSVLYLADGTRFKAARAQDGGPVLDLGNWVSVPRTWTGGSAIRILPAGCWYSFDVEFDADRRLVGYYVNFQTPVVRNASGFDTVDLVLDQVVSPSGEVKLKDMEDFKAAVSAGYIRPDMAKRVEGEAERLANAFRSRVQVPELARWTGWNPPSSWRVPTLP